MQLQLAMRAQRGVPFDGANAHDGALLITASARNLQFEVVKGRLSGMDGRVARPLCSVMEGQDSVERLEARYGPVLEKVVLDGDCREHFACCTHCASGRETAFVAALVRVLQLE